MKTYSIAEAKNRLSEIVHEAETEPVEFARRGVPVAVLVSKSEYERSRPKKSGLWEAINQFRMSAAHELSADDLFRDLRDKSPGRDFRFSE